MQTTTITPDAARAELARLTAAVTAADGAAEKAAATFTAKPSEQAALTKLVTDQQAANARAELAAAREQFVPVFAEEERVRRAAELEAYRRHLATLDADLDPALTAMADATAAFVASVHRVRDLLAERDQCAQQITQRSGQACPNIPAYVAAERMEAVCRGRSLPDLWRQVWHPEHHQWPVSGVVFRGEDAASK